ncbi:AraC family transcriptional regulator [soil metagenome]
MNPVSRALWFVESHSQESLALDEIALACRVSPYHLTRAFAAATGLSLMRYVRGRRLSEAARKLALGADDILRLAIDTGYGSHEAFTRAFRDQFGCTPEQVRGQGNCSNLLLVEAIEMSTSTLPDVTPDRFGTHEPRTFVGLVERYACQAPKGIPAQWQRVGPYLGSLQGQVDHAAYGVVFNFDSDSNFDYLTGVEVRGNPELPQGFQTHQTPKQKYAIFHHKGHIAGIRDVIAAIWNKWLPDSGCQVAKGATLERYPPEFNPMTGMGGFEIWVPIQE